MRLKAIYFLSLLLTVTSGTSCSDSYDNVYLGSGYVFVNDGKSYQSIMHEWDINHYVIPPTVEDYAFDTAFIIAKQRDNSKRSDQEVGKNRTQYWIIAKDRIKVYGPLDSINFVNKQKELSIRLSMRSTINNDSVAIQDLNNSKKPKDRH